MAWTLEQIIVRLQRDQAETERFGSDCATVTRSELITMLKNVATPGHQANSLPLIRVTLRPTGDDECSAFSLTDLPGSGEVNQTPFGVTFRVDRA